MKFTSYQGNSSLNKSCQSNFIPGAVFGTSDMDLKSSAAAELVQLDLPLVKTRLETKGEPFLTFPHPKATMAAGSFGDQALCSGAFLLLSYLILILLGV